MSENENLLNRTITLLLIPGVRQHRTFVDQAAYKRGNDVESVGVHAGDRIVDNDDGLSISFRWRSTTVDEDVEVEGHREPIIEPRIWDQIQVELDTRHTLKGGKARSSKTGLFSSRLICADCGGWYGRKTWASTMKYKHTVWRGNHKYEHDQPCTTATLREEQIENAFLGVLEILSTTLATLSQMRQAINAAFDIQELKLEARRLEALLATI